MKHERERTEGVRCRNTHCKYNDRCFEQSCGAARAADDECLVPVCQQFEPEHTLPSNDQGRLRREEKA